MSQNSDRAGFTSDEWTTLTAVLDEIVPPTRDGRLPGAGQLGLVRAIDEALEKTPELRPLVCQGIASLDDLAHQRNADGFAALAGTSRLEVLTELATRDPGFQPSLIFHTYIAYYQTPQVVEALGLEARPPYPKGYELEMGDLSLLDEVRKRPKMYRD